MKRITDEPYLTHSVVYSAFTTGIQVKCHKCHGVGIVTADEHTAYFKCTGCGHQAEKERTIYRYDVHNQCKNSADTIGWILKRNQISILLLSM